MPNADAVTRYPDAKPCDRAQAAVFLEKDWSLQVIGDPIDASAVADKDRRLADVLLTASDVPGASRHRT